MSDQIEKRKREDQAVLLEKFHSTPIVTIACKLAGISRATFYRWLHEDEEFARSVDQAVQDSVGTVTDMAESNVIGHIKKGDIGTSKYWLKYHHHTYGGKNVVSRVKPNQKILTTEDKELIRKAIEMVKE